MNTLPKRIVALVLALSLCLSLTGSVWAMEDAGVNVDVPLVQEAAEGEEPDTDVPEEADTEADAAEPEEDAEAEAQPEEPKRSETPAALPTEGMLSLLAAEELPDVEQDKDLIERKEAFVRLDKNKTISLLQQPVSPAYFVSKAPKVVSVQKTGTALVVRGVSVGKAVVEMRRSADDALLDRLVVYAYRPTTATRASGTNTRANPADLITSNSAAPTRTYKLVCQQKHSPGDRPYKKFLSHHGCTICASSAVCQAMGATQMTVDWMTGGGLEEVAVRSGFQLEDETLGYYGLQKMLEYGGISSKIYNWKNKETANMEAAKTELVKALSAGRPVLMFIDQKSKWNGIGPLCAALHCIVMVGIDDSGHVQIINSSYPQGVSRFKYGGSEHTVKLTPGELLDHFVRHSKMKREKEDDFYFTKSGGMHTFLEVTCDSATVPQRSSINKRSASLSQTSYTYTGEAFTPQVTLDGLTQDEDYRVLYQNNKNAGTATAVVAGLGNHSGLRKLTFKISRAAGVITASHKAVDQKAAEQTVKLGASAAGSAALSYTSSDQQVKVSDSGVVTVPAYYKGRVKITLRSAQTANYNAAARTIVLTVRDKGLVPPSSLKAGRISVSGKIVATKSTAQKVTLNAKASGSAPLSYTSGDKKVKVSSSGVVTVPKNYVGAVNITVKAAASGGYKAAKKNVKVKVLPAKVHGSSVKALGSGKAQVKWKKNSGVDGYQVQYWSSSDSKGKVRAVKVGKSAASVTLKKLKAGAKYKVRVRSYKKVNGGTLASAWSSKKSVTAK